MSTPPPRTWYLLALVPLAVGAAIVTPMLVRMVGDIREMQRIVVPGARDLTLDAGDYVVYGETSSEVDGVAYVNTGFSVRCSLVGSGDAPVALHAPTAQTSYAFGSHDGKSMFAFTSPAAGTYHFACEGSDQKAVLAVGHGIGSKIVSLVIATFATIIGAAATLVLVRRRRRRAR